MTYLQIVNSVLVRLRENEVSTVSANSYSKLIGELVNDAKRIVEDSWDWHSLRTTITVNTIAGTFSYQLAGTDQGLKTLDIINDTSNCFMTPVSSSYMNNAFLNNDEVARASPKYYSYNGFSESGEALIDFYPVPDKQYVIRINAVDKKGRMSADTDRAFAPSDAIIQYAYALASRERGETGGTSAAELFSIANQTLADRVALDVARSEEETIWKPV
tara:strand:- start:547 stop:1197 length:651 start_codon:yes stop_codon:yes gene_type:complete